MYVIKCPNKSRLRWGWVTGRIHDKKMACRAWTKITPQTQIFWYCRRIFVWNSAHTFQISAFIVIWGSVVNGFGHSYSASDSINQKNMGGDWPFLPVDFFPMSRLIRFSKYVQEHLSRKRKKFSLVCGLNDLFSNITRISKLVGQEVKKRRRRHFCRGAVIGKTSKTAVLSIFWGDRS